MKLILESVEFDIVNFNNSVYYDSGTAQDSITATLSETEASASDIASMIEEDYKDTLTLKAKDVTKVFTGYKLKSIDYHMDDVNESFDIRFEK